MILCCESTRNRSSRGFLTVPPSHTTGREIGPGLDHGGLSDPARREQRANQFSSPPEAPFSAGPAVASSASIFSSIRGNDTASGIVPGGLILEQLDAVS